MAGAVADLALDVCAGRLALALEGGYNLQSLGASAVATIEAINARYGGGEAG
jgi:acetoin utilization deacetylase AcuC-like enzyme